MVESKPQDLAPFISVGLMTLVASARAREPQPRLGMAVGWSLVTGETWCFDYIRTTEKVVHNLALDLPAELGVQRRALCGGLQIARDAQVSSQPLAPAKHLRPAAVPPGLGRRGYAGEVEVVADALALHEFLAPALAAAGALVKGLLVGVPWRGEEVGGVHDARFGGADQEPGAGRHQNVGVRGVNDYAVPAGGVGSGADGGQLLADASCIVLDDLVAAALGKDNLICRIFRKCRYVQLGRVCHKVVGQGDQQQARVAVYRGRGHVVVWAGKAPNANGQLMSQADRTSGQFEPPKSPCRVGLVPPLICELECSVHEHECPTDVSTHPTARASCAPWRVSFARLFSCPLAAHSCCSPVVTMLTCMEEVDAAARKRKFSSCDYAMPHFTARRCAIDGRPAPDAAAAAPSTKTGTTVAARFNAALLRKMQKALEKDPEADLACLLPLNYVGMLQSRKGKIPKADRPKREPVQTNGDHSHDDEQVEKLQPAPRSLLDMSAVLRGEDIKIAHPISESLKDLARVREPVSAAASSAFQTADLCRILEHSTIIWQSETNEQRFIGKCSSELAVKCVSVDKDRTEYTSLLYLERNSPGLPVPKGHGLVTCGHYAFLFMSYVPGSTLDDAWPFLASSAKAQICNELDDFFRKLRLLEKPDDAALGGVANEGCKDTRRHTKVSTDPIFATRDFNNFLYGQPRFGSKMYLGFLSGLLSSLEVDEERCVFTHGDVHTSNITVQYNEKDSSCTLSGIIDWEMSGFYPECFESLKATNTLATNEASDWFLNIPPSISPASALARWLLDRIYDSHVSLQHVILVVPSRGLIVHNLLRDDLLQVCDITLADVCNMHSLLVTSTALRVGFHRVVLEIGMLTGNFEDDVLRAVFEKKRPVIVVAFQGLVYGNRK
ncbi:hypothetical protein FH972_023962 [Carpinus fangiana]|uniref:Aminoglycoside phosphotransferase domain-containing protein n=1 Tax=Carpinus fangiana TaxID=176857 RepID=A0A5N6KXC3_9ROSI|nr:hypothetical protein FH972_023962 [Carpinus fangiana]